MRLELRNNLTSTNRKFNTELSMQPLIQCVVYRRGSHHIAMVILPLEMKAPVHTIQCVSIFLEHDIAEDFSVDHEITIGDLHGVLAKHCDAIDFDLAFAHQYHDVTVKLNPVPTGLIITTTDDIHSFRPLMALFNIEITYSYHRAFINDDGSIRGHSLYHTRLNPDKQDHQRLIW